MEDKWRPEHLGALRIMDENVQKGKVFGISCLSTTFGTR